MSLILKGLDMPKYLNKPLRLEIHADGHVWIDHGTDYEYIDDVAVQIPKPHGRLKDVSELENDGRFAWRLAHTPTILEAEEE